MPGMTQRELLYLQDAIDSERLMVQKFGTCADNATDPDVKRICQDIQQTHQTHQQTLEQYLSTVQPGTQ